MTKNKKPKSKPKSTNRWLWIAGGAVVLVLIATLVWFVSVNSTPRAAPNTNSADIASALPNSDNSFSVGTLIGKPAPAFTLPDA